MGDRPVAKRVLLKVSGEVFGGADNSIDLEMIEAFGAELKDARAELKRYEAGLSAVLSKPPVRAYRSIKDLLRHVLRWRPKADRRTERNRSD